MENQNTRPIGIFDSGVGGLTVAKSLRRYLPNEDIIYFGDTARVPYGNKSRSTIIRFSCEIMSFMMKCGVKMVVVACNTASSFSLQVLKEAYPVPVIGVISPGVKEAVRISKNGRVGVIGTAATISSGAYEKELKKTAPAYHYFGEACPLFVPLVENRFMDDTVTYAVAQRYLKKIKSKKIDTLILGCTHYPLLKNVLSKVAGDGVRLVDSSFAVADEVKRILSEKDLGNDKPSYKGKMRCFVSDDVENFKKTAKIFLKENISVKKAVL